jgi:hypothetical protein
LDTVLLPARDGEESPLATPRGIPTFCAGAGVPAQNGRFILDPVDKIRLI